MSKKRKVIENTREALIAAMPPKPSIPRRTWSKQLEYVEGSPITSTEDDGCVGVLWPTTATYDRRGRRQFRIFFGWKIPFQQKKGGKLLLLMNQKTTTSFGWLEDI